MESAPGRWSTVGVDAQDRVGPQRIGHVGALVDARSQSGVVAAGQGGPDTQCCQCGANPQRGVPGEGVLHIAAVGRGSAGLAVLGAAPAGGDLPADGRVVGAVVAGVDENHHAGDAGRDPHAFWAAVETISVPAATSMLAAILIPTRLLTRWSTAQR